MYSIDKQTKRILAMHEQYGPLKGNYAAMCFDTHDKCTNVHPLEGGTIGVIERNDGATLALWTLYGTDSDSVVRHTAHDEMVTGWEYSIHPEGQLFTEIIASDGLLGSDINSIARNIAETVTTWLDASPIPDPLTQQRDADELAATLEDTCYYSKLTTDADGQFCIKVYLDVENTDDPTDVQEATAYVYIDYIHGGYAVSYFDEEKLVTSTQCADLNALITLLRTLGA